MALIDAASEPEEVSPALMMASSPDGREDDELQPVPGLDRRATKNEPSTVGQRPYR
jgi:hypothetical protein